jgi:hypothetical protein
VTGSWAVNNKVSVGELFAFRSRNLNSLPPSISSNFIPHSLRTAERHVLFISSPGGYDSALGAHNFLPFLHCFTNSNTLLSLPSKATFFLETFQSCEWIVDAPCGTSAQEEGKGGCEQCHRERQRSLCATSTQCAQHPAHNRDA